jgi:hypothetical protein
MVGGVFSQFLGTTGNPAAQNAKHDTSNHKKNEYKENRLSFIEVQELTHPSNHLGEKITDLRKQSSNSRGSGLKSSSFHKIFFMDTCHGRSRRTNKEKAPAKTIK